MVTPGLVEKLRDNHKSLSNNKTSLEWKQYTAVLEQYVEILKNPRTAKTSSLMIIAEREKKKTDNIVVFEANFIKNYVFDLLQDLYGVFKDIKICHQFGDNKKSIWIVNQLMMTKEQDSARSKEYTINTIFRLFILFYIEILDAARRLFPDTQINEFEQEEGNNSDVIISQQLCDEDPQSTPCSSHQISNLQMQRSSDKLSRKKIMLDCISYKKSLGMHSSEGIFILMLMTLYI